MFLHGIEVNMTNVQNLYDIHSLPKIKLTYNRISKANIHIKIRVLKNAIPKPLSTLNPYGQSFKLIKGYIIEIYPLHYCIKEGA